MRPIPAIGYGTWPLAGRAARDGVLMALDIGFRHIDTAQLYTNERGSTQQHVRAPQTTGAEIQ